MLVWSNRDTVNLTLASAQQWPPVGVLQRADPKEVWSLTISHYIWMIVCKCCELWLWLGYTPWTHPEPKTMNCHTMKLPWNQLGRCDAHDAHDWGVILTIQQSKDSDGEECLNVWKMNDLLSLHSAIRLTITISHHPMVDSRHNFV